MVKIFDERWKDWVNVNVDRGCSKDELFRILLDEGFAHDAIECELDHKPAVDLSKVVNPLNVANTAPRRDLAATLASAATLRIDNLKVLASYPTRLYTADSFLDRGECAGLVSLVKGHLRVSTISVTDEPDKYFRVSQTCDLSHLADPLVGDVERKIHAAMQIGAEFSEVTQAQHYDVGGEFKAHTDYFENHELERFSTPTLGQRTWTFMIYLNEPEQGGETAFERLGIIVRPKLGMAVIWSNVRPDGQPDLDTLHRGMPVKAGHKTIITKWFRSPR